MLALPVAFILAKSALPCPYVLSEGIALTTLRRLGQIKLAKCAQAEDFGYGESFARSCHRKVYSDLDLGWARELRRIYMSILSAE